MSLLDDLFDPVDAPQGDDAELRRQTELLGMLVDLEGTTATPNVRNPVRHDHLMAPATRDLQVVPPGDTTIDFSTGRIDHEFETGPVEDGIRTIGDVSKDLEEGRARLRSLYITVDSFISLSIGDNPDDFQLNPGATYPIPATGFEKVHLANSAACYGFRVVASTTRFPVGISSTSETKRRAGQASGTGSALDSFTDVDWSHNSINNAFSGSMFDSDRSSNVLNCFAFKSHTFVAENATGSANDMDARIVGRQDASDDFVEIARQDNISNGDHHIFNINQSWGVLKMQIQNSTNGNDITADCQYGATTQ